MMKRLFLLVVLALAFVLPSIITAQDAVELSIISTTGWFDEKSDSAGGGSTAGYTMMQDYTKANPNVTFKVQAVPFGDLDSTQLASMESKQGPDIMIVNSV